MLEVLINPALILISKFVIDKLTHPNFDGRVGGSIFLASLLFVCISLLMDLLKPINESKMKLLTARFSRRIDNLLMKKANSFIGIAPFENATFHTKTPVFQTNTVFTTIWIDILIRGYSGIILITISSVMLWYLVPWAPFVLLLMGFPRLFIESKLNNLLYEGREEVQDLRRRSEYLMEQPLLPDTGHEMKLFKLLPFFKKEYISSSNNLINLIKHDQKKWVIHRFVWGFIESILIGVIFLYLLIQITLNTITPGDIALFIGAIFQLHNGIGGFFGILAVGAREAIQLRNLLDFIDSDPSETITKTDCPSKTGLDDLKYGYKFENVRFSYDGKNTVLDIDDLEIPKGQITALVGENGAGKTSLVNLLCRFYDPDSGNISLNNKSIKEYDINELRKKYTVVFQDFIKYEMTVKENIGIGKIQNISDENLIKYASFFGGSSEIIDNLDNGYETQLGRLFGGKELSGGQWQRIALSRAFMRYEDSEIIILDEPTSALDAKVEYDLFKRMKMLCKGKTVILISHRLSTVNMADNIVFLENGKVSEKGDHESLMKLGGKYAELYNLHSKMDKQFILKESN